MTSATVVNTDPHGARPPEGRLPAELQCQPRRGHHPGRRPVGADFDRRHGSLGHRQHEARAQRRAHDRHAGRRQHRDPRPCRGREHLHLRPDRRTRSSSAGRRGLDARARIAASAPARAPRPFLHRGGVSRRTTRTGFVAWSKRCSTTTISWCAADFDAYWTAQRAVDALYGKPALVAVGDPQHRAHGLVFVGPRHSRICRKGVERAPIDTCRSLSD